MNNFMCIFYIFFFFGLVGVPIFLRSDLDGSINPIYVTSRYTFTNGESAIGNVYFKNGFDLPTGGTVTLDITQEVRQVINFDNSTLILGNDLRLGRDAQFKGKGYIDAGGNEIYFIEDQLFDSSDSFTFISDVRWRSDGSKSILIYPNAAFVFTEGITLAEFHNLNLQGLGDDRIFDTGYTAPQTLLFLDCNINIVNNQNFSLNSQVVLLCGSVALKGKKSTLSIPYQCRLGASNSKVLVSPEFTLQPRLLRCAFNQAQLTLDNATLQYTMTDPEYSLFGGNPSVGDFNIRGQSQIKAPVDTILRIDKSLVM